MSLRMDESNWNMYRREVTAIIDKYLSVFFFINFFDKKPSTYYCNICKMYEIIRCEVDIVSCKTKYFLVYFLKKKRGYVYLMITSL